MNKILNKPKLHRRVWKKKKILREAYLEWYKQILTDLRRSTNKTIEIGAGCGNFKEFKPDIIACDIQSNPWINYSFDAHNMPFNSQSIANIVLIDTLHHLYNPIKFLHEAGRILESKGRLIMIEPYPSFFSSLIYKKFHPEPFIMDINYFGRISNVKCQKNLLYSNQGIAFLLFFKNYQKTMSKFKTIFHTIKIKKMSYFLYPASGGFEYRQLIPDFMISFTKLMEYLLTPFKDLLAFRCYIVLEKI